MEEMRSGNHQGLDPVRPFRAMERNLDSILNAMGDLGRFTLESDTSQCT